MKILSAITAAMLITTSYGFAQADVSDNGSNASIESTESVSGESEANTYPEEMSDNSYEAAIIAIETSGQVEFEILDLGDIRVLRLSELDGDMATEGVLLDQALDANSDAQAALHASVSDNDVLVEKLGLEGNFAVTDVIAVRASPSGQLIVYVDDRQVSES